MRSRLSLVLFSIFSPPTNLCDHRPQSPPPSPEKRLKEHDKVWWFIPFRRNLGFQLQFDKGRERTNPIGFSCTLFVLFSHNNLCQLREIRSYLQSTNKLKSVAVKNAFKPKTHQKGPMSHRDFIPAAQLISDCRKFNDFRWFFHNFFHLELF